jgi:hypothetical protein
MSAPWVPAKSGHDRSACDPVRAKNTYSEANLAKDHEFLRLKTAPWSLALHGGPGGRFARGSASRHCLVRDYAALEAQRNSITFDARIPLVDRGEHPPNDPLQLRTIET